MRIEFRGAKWGRLSFWVDVVDDASWDLVREVCETIERMVVEDGCSPEDISDLLYVRSGEILLRENGFGAWIDPDPEGREEI